MSNNWIWWEYRSRYRVYLNHSAETLLGFRKDRACRSVPTETALKPAVIQVVFWCPCCRLKVGPQLAQLKRKPVGIGAWIGFTQLVECCLADYEGPALWQALPSNNTTTFRNLLSSFRWKVLEHVVDVAIHYSRVFICIGREILCSQTSP
jgi:hypothetical protein